MQAKNTAQKQPTKLIRIDTVLEKTGLSRSTLYRLIKQGNFPVQVKLSDRVAAWSCEAVDAWIDAKLGGCAA
ncbi:MAG: AlpA family transcriptional regulator [Methylococcaceae bacterium]